MMDTATGLIYVGNGQYYDPSTGRFLTRDANPDQTNPYVPWKSDPTSLLISPLALLALVYSGKRKRSKLDIVVVLMVVCGVLGLGLAGCGPTTPGGGTPIPILETPFNYNDTPTPGTSIAIITTPEGKPIETPEYCGLTGLSGNIRYDIIVFGGSNSQLGIKAGGPEVPESVGVWTSDDKTHAIYEQNLIKYKGYIGDISGKAIQQEEARGKAPCDNVIIIGYSAGTESALMYARWRILQTPQQPVRAVVLLGPTFVSYNETGLGNILYFGSTNPAEQDDSGRVKEPNDWADYVTTLLATNVDVYVLADSGSFAGEAALQADAAQKYATENLSHISGEYFFDLQPNVNHHFDTINDTSIKEKIYAWVN